MIGGMCTEVCIKGFHGVNLILFNGREWALKFRYYRRQPHSDIAAQNGLLGRLRKGLLQSSIPFLSVRAQYSPL